MYQDRNLKDIAVGDKVVMHLPAYRQNGYARAIVTKVTKTQFVIALQDNSLIDIVYEDPRNRSKFERVEVTEIRFNKAGRVIKREEDVSIAINYVDFMPNGLMTWEDLDAYERRKVANVLQEKLAREVSKVNFKGLSADTLADIMQLVNSDPIN